MKLNNMPAPFGLLQIQGPDASKFLQGQVTCDVTQTTLTQGVYGAHCNPKGRILFSFYLLRRAEDCFWLQIPQSMTEPALKDLGKYSVFSKVKLSRIDLPMRLVKTSIQLEQSIMQDEQGVIRKRSNGYTEIIGQPLAFDQFTDSAEETHHWNLLDIQEGIAWIYPETRELFTPEEINFTLIDAVSFRKGCYTGQEIVARMHYKGKHKRHAHRFQVESVEIPVPGIAILSSENDQKIGELISAASVSDHLKFECLASIQDEARNTALLSTNQEKMQVVSLPYAIPVSDIE
jgi:tRNA-modifying protein YgfZ